MPAKRTRIVIANAFQHERQLADKNPPRIMWTRRELDMIRACYGRQVARGIWRDYGIDALETYAVFSVFRRSREAPLYRIEKHPALRTRQGEYAVVAMGGRIVKRGNDLQRVLRVLERAPHLQLVKN